MAAVLQQVLVQILEQQFLVGLAMVLMVLVWVMMMVLLAAVAVIKEEMPIIRHQGLAMPKVALAM